MVHLLDQLSAVDRTTYLHVFEFRFAVDPMSRNVCSSTPRELVGRMNNIWALLLPSFSTSRSPLVSDGKVARTARRGTLTTSEAPQVPSTISTGRSVIVVTGLDCKLNSICIIRIRSDSYPICSHTELMVPYATYATSQIGDGESGL
jgi:hypothetical protein